MIYRAFSLVQTVQSQSSGRVQDYYAPACELLQTIIPSTPLVPHWAEVTCSVPRPPQTFPELHIAASIVEPGSERYPALTAAMAFPARSMFSAAPRAPSMATLAVLESALSGLRISTPAAAGSQVWRRHASHQAQGRANKAADGAGKRLGAKKSGGEFVVPGNIIFKQRGTLWFPGDNCSMVSLLGDWIEALLRGQF